MAKQTIQVSVLADTRKFGSAMSKVGKATGLTALGNAAQRVSNRVGNFVKTSVKRLGILTGVVAAMAIKGGLKRALDIEDATKALEGLGHNTKTIDKIMRNALKSVKGTAFGLGDAATIASTAVAAGIKPGKHLTRTLKLTANTAALAKTDLTDMGSILNKVWTNNKAQTQELNQIADRGIPIWTKLADHYKVNGSELRKLVSSGKVDAATFAKVLEKTVGNAASKMGEGTRGMARNMTAALSRAGEGFVSKLLPHVKTALTGLTGMFDNLAPLAQRAGEAAGKWITNTLIPALTKAANWIKTNVLPRLADLGTWLTTKAIPAAKQTAAAISAYLLPRLTALGGWIKTTVIPAAQSMATTFTTRVLPVLKTLGSFLITSVIPALNNTVQWVARNRKMLVTIAAPILAIVVAWKAYQRIMLVVKTVQTVFNTTMAAGRAIQQAYMFGTYGQVAGNTTLMTTLAALTGALRTKVIAMTTSIAAGVRAVATTTAQITVLTAQKVALGASAAAQWLLNAAMSANPIGLIVTAIALVVAGLTVFFTKTKTGQKIFTAAWNGIKSAATRVANAVRNVLSGIWTFIKKVWGFSPVGLVVTNWNKITGAFSTGYNSVKSWLNKALGVVKSVWKYTPMGMITTNWTKIINWFKEIPTKVKSVFGDAVDWLKEAGKNIVQGLLDGIGSLAKTIGSWFLDRVPGWIKTPFKKALGIHSPSKVFKGYGINIIQGLVKGLDGSRSQAGAAVDRIVRKVRDIKGFKGDKSALIKWVQDEGKALDTQLKKHERIVDKLKKQNDKLKQLRTDRAALRDQVASGITGTLNLTDALVKNEDGSIATGKTTASGIRALVASMKAKAGVYKERMKKLVKAGFSPAFVQMLAGYGLDEASEIARAILAGSAADQSAIKADFKGFNQTATQVGNVVAGQMFDAGIKAQEGLIKGLEKDNKKLEKAASKIAKKITTKVKQELGIKSPSRVFRRLGQYTIDGLAQGLNQMTRVNTAMQRVSNTITGGYDPTLTLGGRSAPARTTTYKIDVTVSPGGEAEAGRQIVKAIKAFERVNGKVLTS